MLRHPARARISHGGISRLRGLGPDWGAPGFERGFDIYDARFGLPLQQTRGCNQSRARRGADVVAHAVEWLKQRPDGPFFLWVHLYDAHDPYEPPEPTRRSMRQSRTTEGLRTKISRWEPCCNS